MAYQHHCKIAEISFRVSVRKNVMNGVAFFIANKEIYGTIHLQWKPYFVRDPFIFNNAKGN